MKKKENKKNPQVMQRQYITTSYKQIIAQPISKQWLPNQIYPSG